MTNAPLPPEHNEGQETEPPDVLLALIVTVHLLEDIKSQRVEGDLELRRAAVLAVLRRLRRHIEDAYDGDEKGARE